MIKGKWKESLADHKKWGKTRAAAPSSADRRKAIGKHLNFGASEAYKLLRTNLIFSMADESGCKVVGMTSALPGEGKSTTSINLAYALAQSGKKVLLIEADMRIPVLASILQIDAAPGLAHVLAGISKLNDAVRPSTLLRTMFVLPAGEIPPNPSEMLSSQRMKQVIEALVPAFEYIIIDLPPINAVSDGLAISKLLSGMIVVVRQNYCDQSALAEAMRRMELLEVRLLGFVLNSVDSSESRYKKYSGGSKYGHQYRYGYGYGKKPKGSADSVDEAASPAPTYEPETDQRTGSHV